MIVFLQMGGILTDGWKGRQPHSLYPDHQQGIICGVAFARSSLRRVYEAQGTGRKAQGED
jgi:hypothetical protein